MDTTILKTEYSTHNSIRASLIFLGALVMLVLFPLPHAEAATDLKVSGWIPYWADEEGIASAKDNLGALDTVHPFVFSVKSDGSVADLADMDERQWKRFTRDARRKDIEVIPTIMWSDGANIHTILSNDKLRKAHVEAIADLVEEGKYDGIDIDYESKRAETKDDFSTFLRELKRAIGRSKVLACTIEARTPPESRYRQIPSVIEYANDFREINNHCDRVEIMAYDQQRIDWKLNTEKNGEPYIPVADIDWVEKVVKLALKDIDTDKIMLGVPTYGREWTLTIEPEWLKEYSNIRAVNMPDAENIADRYDVKPGRNKAGELSFTYFPESSVFKILNALPTPKGTREGHEASAKALLFANATGMTVPVNVVWFSDAVAIADKVALAEKYDLRGIAVFKIDGEEDSSIWEVLE